MLHKPELIILDEPTTGLDPQGIIEIRNLILRLKNEQNKTILLSSHQLSEIELIANRMVIITKGKSLVEGNVQELLNAQELTVRLELSDVNKAIPLIQQHFVNVEITRINEVEISLSIEKQQVPHLNKMLGDNNILVYALEPKRKLEDFFMKIVQS